MASQQLLYFGMRRPHSWLTTTTTMATTSRRRIPDFTRQTQLLRRESAVNTYTASPIITTTIRTYSRHHAQWVPQAYRKFDEQQQQHKKHGDHRKHNKRRPGGFRPRGRSGSFGSAGVGPTKRRGGHPGRGGGGDSSRSRHYNRSKHRNSADNNHGNRFGAAATSSSSSSSSSSNNIFDSSPQKQQETNSAAGSGRYSFQNRSSGYDVNEPSQHFYRVRKIELMQQNLSKLLQQYQRQVFDETKVLSALQEQQLSSDNGKSNNNTNDTISNDSIMVRHMLQSLHDYHDQLIDPNSGHDNTLDASKDSTTCTNSDAVSLDQLKASEQTFAEMCRLMQRLIGTWAKQQVNPEGMSGDTEQNNEKAQKDKDDNSKTKTTTTTTATVENEIDLRILPYNIAEDLLIAFVQLRSDRARLVKNAHETELKHNQDLHNISAQNSWSGWLKHVFVVNDGKGGRGINDHDDPASFEEDSSTNGQQLSSMSLPATATHLDPAYAPNARLFRDVMKTVYDQTPVGIVSLVESQATQEHNDDIYRWRARLGGLLKYRPTQEIRRANRISRLLDVMCQNDLVPDTHVLEIVIQSHGDVANLEFAKKAERIYYKYGLRQGINLFHSLLRAYRMASFFEKNQPAKVQAAKQAEWLLQKRESVLMKRNVAGDAAKGGSIGEGRRMHQLSHISYNLVLQTLSNPGIKALPDMCARAESLIELWMGKEAFRRLVNANEEDDMHASVLLPRTSEVPDLNVFHHLILLYVSSGRPDKMERAKRLLRYMQRNSDQSHYPNVFTYNGILRGLLHQNRKLMRMHDAGKGRMDNSCKRDAAVNSTFAHEMLDSMSDNPWSRPNRETFMLLINMWKSSKSSQGGDRAQELLSRMETYSGIAGNDWHIQRDSYQSTMQCWVEAAAAGQAGAAERAYRILLSMETQSGSGFLNFPKDPAGGPNMKLWSQVDEATLTARNAAALEPYKDYLCPVAFDYNSVMETCSKTCLPSDRDIALEIAFDAYNRMIARGVRPTSRSYSALLNCCATLLPDAPDRRMELARTVFQAASSENKVNDSVLKAFGLAKNGESEDTSSPSSLKSFDNTAEAESSEEPDNTGILC